MISKERLLEAARYVDEHDVPEVYWKNSGMLEEIEGVFSDAKTSLEKMNNPSQMSFEEHLWRFTVASFALNRIKTGKSTLPNPTTEENVLHAARAFVSAKRNEKEALFKELEANVHCLNALPSVDELRVANKRVEREEQRAVQGKRTKRAVFIILGVLAGMALLGTIGWFAYQRFFKPPDEPVVTPTPIIETQIVEVIITATPESPVPTVVPTPTSQFVSLPLESVVPNPPYGLEPLFLIDDSAAIFEPSDGVLWRIGESGIGGTHHYIQEVDPAISASVIWVVDQPLLDDGRYELFVLDPLRLAGGRDAFTYEVYASEVLLQPITGTNVIIQETSATQKGDQWLSIGIYDFKAGDQIKVRLAVPNKLGGYYDYLGVDAVLVSKLPTLDPFVIEPLQSPEVHGKNILYSVDDRKAYREPADPSVWQWIEANPGNWGGVFVAEVPADAGKPYSIFYDFARPVYPGLYELWAWVPADAAVPVEMKVEMKTADTAKVPATAYLELLPSVDPVAEGFRGKPVKIATFQLDRTAVSLQVTASSVAGQSGRFALDDLYLVLLPPAAVGDGTAQ